MSATATQTTRPQGPGTQLAQREQTARDLDAIANQFAVQLRTEGNNRMMRAVVIGQAVNQLRDSIKPLLPVFMGLQNSRLGFKTDKPEGYPENVVRDCLVAALIHGVDPTGNEFNIISGDCYVTKEGYLHKMKTIDGITDLDIIPGTPAQHNGQTVVRVAVSCKIHGQPWFLKDHEGKAGRIFPIRVNSGMGVDAILGKATRKALKAAFEQITGTEQTLPDGDVDDKTPTTSLPAQPANGNEPSKTASLANRLPAATNGNGKEPTPTDETASEEAHAAVVAEITRVGLSEKQVVELAKQVGAKRIGRLTATQAQRILDDLRELPDAREPGADDD